LQNELHYKIEKKLKIISSMIMKHFEIIRYKYTVHKCRKENEL
jgi:hypothetical protein